MTDEGVGRAVLATLEKKTFADLDPQYIEHANLNACYTQKNKKTRN